MKTTHPTSENWKRTVYGGDLRAEHEGRNVTLVGWVQRVRNMGGLLFVDLRDRRGLVQIVVSTDRPDLLDEVGKARPENVAGFRGVVRRRDPKSVNSQMETGEIEVVASAFRLINTSKVPPFVIGEQVQASEELGSSTVISIFGDRLFRTISGSVTKPPSG